MEILIALIAVIVFGTGLGIGWTMRGSVKEENLHQVTCIFEQIQKVNWKLDEIKKESKL